MSYVRGPGVRHWHSIDTINSGVIPPQQGATTSATWYSANGAIYCPVIVRSGVVVKKLWVATGTTGTGNVDVGLFNATGVKLTSSGAIAHGTTNTELVSDVTDVTIAPGIYYLGVSASNSTDTFFGVSVAAPFPTALGYLTEASAHPLPATATFALTQTLAWMPDCGMLLNTLVS